MPESKPKFLIDHFPGCSPLEDPCVSCRAAELLRQSALSPSEINQLRALALEAYGEPVPACPDDTPVSELEVEVRTANILKNEGIETIGVLASKTEAEIRRWPNSGQRTFDDLRQALAKKGRRFAEPPLKKARKR